jgi:hypothetical protein
VNALTSGECTDSFVCCMPRQLNTLSLPTFGLTHTASLFSLPANVIFTLLCLCLRQPANKQRSKSLQQRNLTTTLCPPRTATHIMADPRAPNNAEVKSYIESRSVMEMMHLLRGIDEPAAQAAFAAKLLLTPSSAVVTSATPEKVEKSKQALNAFVGFRCTYRYRS